MFRPIPELQICAGISMILLSVGGAWSMVSGSVVQLRVAGANFSVNQKLQRVESAKEILSDVTDQLSTEPKADRRKIRQAEQQLQLAEPKIKQTETQIEQDLDKLTKIGGE